MTSQLDLWKSGFGDEYLVRNSINRDDTERLFRNWGTIMSRAISPRPQSALEVGCNIGRNLVVLKHMVTELHGVEPNAQACEAARANPDLAGVNIVSGDGFALPFEDSSIDLVFTSGVLIHVAPDGLDRVMAEIHRVAKRYILAIEYFSHTPVSVPYRGLDGYLFKRDFGGHYLDQFPELQVVDYGFFWTRLDSFGNSNWWLFAK